MLRVFAIILCLLCFTVPARAEDEKAHCSWIMNTMPQMVHSYIASSTFLRQYLPSDTLICSIERTSDIVDFPYAYFYGQGQSFQRYRRHDIAYHFYKKALFNISGTVPWDMGIYYTDPQYPTYDSKNAYQFYYYYFTFFFSQNIAEAPHQCEFNLNTVYGKHDDDEPAIIHETFQEVLSLCQKSPQQIFDIAFYHYNRNQTPYDRHIAWNLIRKLNLHKFDFNDFNFTDQIELFHSKLKKELGKKSNL